VVECSSKVVVPAYRTKQGHTFQKTLISFKSISLSSAEVFCGWLLFQFRIRKVPGSNLETSSPEDVRCFPQTHYVNAWVVGIPQNRPRPPPFITFPIHYSLQEKYLLVFVVIVNLSVKENNILLNTVVITTVNLPLSHAGSWISTAGNNHIPNTYWVLCCMCWSSDRWSPVQLTLFNVYISKSHNIQSNRMHKLFPDILYFLLVNPTCFDPSCGHHQGFISKQHFK
jgi:hypothetical protein